MNEDHSSNKNFCHILTLFLFIIQIIFSWKITPSLFWNLDIKYFVTFSIQCIKSNCKNIFFIFVSVIFSWYVVYSSPFKFIYERFSFYYYFWILSNYVMAWFKCCSILKLFIFIFIDGIYCCLFYFFIQSEKSI